MRLLRTGLLCLVVLGTALGGCKESKPAPAPTVQDTSPVPAPQGLLADLVLSKPDATLGQLRTQLGGPLQLLPATFPSLVVTLLGLSPQLIDQIDGASPAFGAMTDEGPRTGWVLAIHLRDGTKALSVLTQGPEAKYGFKQDPSGVVLLEPKTTVTSRVSALGISNSYLLLGGQTQDLTKTGPYVVRTVSKRPADQAEALAVLPREALQGPIAKRLREGWEKFRKEREADDKLQREKHGGKAPDFGEPAAALGDIEGKVTRLTALLSDLQEARLTLNTDAQGLHLRLGMNPSSPNGASAQEFASLRTGDVEPILKLPRNTVLALLFRDSAEARRKDSTQQADSLQKILGERLTAPQSQQLHKVLEGWSQSRGDWLTANLVWSPTQQALWAHGALQDPKALDESVRGFLTLLQTPAFKEPIESHWGKVTIGKPGPIEGGQVVRIKREPKVKSKNERTDFDFGWRTSSAKDAFDIAIVPEAKPWFTALDKSPAPPLSEQADVAAALRALGKDVSFTMFVQPNRLLAGMFSKKDVTAELPSAPVIFAYGGTQQQGWYRADLSYEALKQLLQMVAVR